MQLDWKDHFNRIVLRALDAYTDAEARLIAAQVAGGDVELARFDALREGGAAATYLHHFSDLILNRRPPQLPAATRNIDDVREWLARHCNPADDVKLLRDLVDALKHAELVHRLNDRQVPANAAVLVTGSTQSGGEVVIVALNSGGARELAALLNQVRIAWRNALGF